MADGAGHDYAFDAGRAGAGKKRLGEKEAGEFKASLVLLGNVAHKAWCKRWKWETARGPSDLHGNVQLPHTDTRTRQAGFQSELRETDLVEIMGQKSSSYLTGSRQASRLTDRWPYL